MPSLLRLCRPFAVPLSLACLLAAPPRAAWALPEGFIDPEDHHLDISGWLIERKGFLPVPIIITEPAVGYGGGVALMFLRNSMRESAQNKTESGHTVPPDIWVVGGAATENGTKAAFAGGMASFDDDRWRYRGGIGRADVNLSFYGIGGTLAGAKSLDYSMDGSFSSQQLLRRLGDSNTWLGARWIYMNLGIQGQNALAGDPRSLLAPDQLSRRNSGLGLSLEHDSRDNVFTPNRGWTGALEATFYDPRWGSDTRFESYRAHAFGYWPLSKSLVLGGRIDARSVSGRVPFYMMPFIDMRGVPAGRYQDRHTAVLEAELRWDVTPRWALVGFAGAGRAWGSGTSFSEASTAVSRGVGVRYQIARRLGMWVGVDYARGPEGGVTYLQVGSAWR